jgi:hypothetical protein
MAGEADQTLLTTDDDVATDVRATFHAESDITARSSTSNAATQKIVKKDIPSLQDYWNKSTVTEADHAAYHTAGWLSGGVVSSISELDFPMVDNSTIVCFESHLIDRLGLPPSKFLVSVLNFLRCELVHLNPIITFSSLNDHQ